MFFFDSQVGLEEAEALAREAANSMDEAKILTLSDCPDETDVRKIMRKRWVSLNDFAKIVETFAYLINHKLDEGIPLIVGGRVTLYSQYLKIPPKKRPTHFEEIAFPIFGTTTHFVRRHEQSPIALNDTNGFNYAGGEKAAQIVFWDLGSNETPAEFINKVATRIRQSDLCLCS